MKMANINGSRGLASVASAFYKIIKIIDRDIKVFGFSLAALASLHRFSGIFIFKASPSLYFAVYFSHEVPRG